MSESEVDREVHTLLMSKGQRYTDGRRRLVSALQSGDGPLTITQLLAADNTLSQSSAYRNLTVLEDVGAVIRIMTHDDFARYELAEHITGHHHHLICTQCGDVTDFSLDAPTERSLEGALHRAAEPSGFDVRGHRLDLLGVCHDCT